MLQVTTEGGSPSNTLIAIGANATSQDATTKDFVTAGLERLSAEGFAVEARSSLFMTPAFPPGSGAPYLNAAVVARSSLPAEAQLAALHRIEDAFGRVRTRRWGPRTLDLDLLAVGDAIRPDAETLRRWIDLPLARQVTEEPEHLILPHPRLQDRGFVLAPLAQIAPGWRHPLLGLTVAEMLAALPPEATEGFDILPG